MGAWRIALLFLVLATACAAEGNDVPIDATGPGGNDLPDTSDPADLPSPDDTVDVSTPGCRTTSPAELATFERTLVVACWDGEELGLLGSAAYAERARDEGEDLVAVYTLDMLGYVDATPGAQEMPPEIQLLAPTAYKEVQEGGAKGDFLAILADPAHLVAANLFAAYATEAGSKTYVLKIPDALKLSDEAASLRNSDHAAFWEAGFSALAVSDTGPLRNPYLHCAGGPDTIATLDVAFAVGGTRGLVGSAAEVLGLREAHPER
jgi:Zn-dependent M28 family amino/carboxypeptidase